MNPIHYHELDETVYREVLENGLTVTVVPRKGFTKTLAYFVTDYGSVHSAYRMAGEELTFPMLEKGVFFAFPIRLIRHNQTSLVVMETVYHFIV